MTTAVQRRLPSRPLRGRNAFGDVSVNGPTASAARVLRTQTLTKLSRQTQEGE